MNQTQYTREVMATATALMNEDQSILKDIENDGSFDAEVRLAAIDGALGKIVDSKTKAFIKAMRLAETEVDKAAKLIVYATSIAEREGLE